MYNLIVVDPPWELKKIKRSKRPKQISLDYPTMSLEEISNMPIGDIGDGWCFLWTTQKYLFQSKDILEKWGFKYLLTMVWEKTYGVSSGMPIYGFRWNSEFILVGYKVKPLLYSSGALIPTSFQAENIKHSQKPDKFYEMIEKLGDRRVDIFARQRREGWTSIGNEIDGVGIKESLDKLMA